ncbi:MAG: type II toxin-antitoxin system CcdA family antitoxin [Rhodospirillaceae bacterium]|nr:type II toxin-antitoxin system CcdA family antitoxin [Rhodospirillaceae bacterium]
MPGKITPKLSACASIFMRVIYAQNYAHRFGDMWMNVRRPKTSIPRQSVNVSVRGDIVAQAKKLGLNLSQITEAALAHAINAAAFEDWKKANARALGAHRKRVERHGALLDGLRTF